MKTIKLLLFASTLVIFASCKKEDYSDGEQQAAVLYPEELDKEPTACAQSDDKKACLCAHCQNEGHHKQREIFPCPLSGRRQHG